MKNLSKIVQSLILLMLVAGIESNAQIKFKVSGVITGYEGGKVQLKILETTMKPLKTYTANIVNGRYSFAGDMEYPSTTASLDILAGEKKANFKLALDSGFNEHKIDFTNAPAKIKVLNSVSDVIRIRLDSVNKIPLKDSISLEGRVVDRRTLSYFKVLEEYPDNFYSLWSLVHITRFAGSLSYSDLILDTYDRLGEDLRSSSFGKYLYEKESKKIANDFASQNGKKAPIFTTLTNDKTQFSNASLKGEVYLIVFTASWCGPCRKQLPELKALYGKYKSKGLKLVYVSSDEKLSEWMAYTKNSPKEWIYIPDNINKQFRVVSPLYSVQYLPTHFLINRAGEIVFNTKKANGGMRELEMALEKEL
ncbi:TlpA disulfide reductase family protein [Pedobacter frigoris]|uniref:TlpA family protein disulfide reductase n=1 Tax=Pedobacter frigoris TaxID=2571272 RepID=UPI0029306B47|nr:TlpA disulfide reductase family protein [Pedobacter frigoris]